MPSGQVKSSAASPMKLANKDVDVEVEINEGGLGPGGHEEVGVDAVSKIFDDGPLGRKEVRIDDDGDDAMYEHCQLGGAEVATVIVVVVVAVFVAFCCFYSCCYGCV